MAAGGQHRTLTVHGLRVSVRIPPESFWTREVSISGFEDLHAARGHTAGLRDVQEHADLAERLRSLIPDEETRRRAGPQDLPLPEVQRELEVQDPLHPVRSTAFWQDLETSFRAVQSVAEPLLREAFANGMAFKVKFSATFHAVVNGEPCIWGLNMVPIDVGEGQARGFLDRMRRFFAFLRYKLVLQLDNALARASDVVILGLSRALLLSVPGERLRRLHERAGLNVSGAGHVPLPKELEAKHAVLNLTNRDHQCFQYCVVANELRLWEKGVRNPFRFQHYAIRSDGQPLKPARLPSGVYLLPKPTGKELDFSMLDREREVDLEQIDAFETRNRYQVHVFEWRTVRGRDGQELSFAHKIRSPQEDSSREKGEVTLLLHEGHYTLVHRFSALMGSRGEGTFASRVGHELKWCQRCLQHFTSEERLLKHQAGCNENERPAEKVRCLPKDDKKGRPPLVQFLSWGRQLRQPLVVYADFETYYDPLEHEVAAAREAEGVPQSSTVEVASNERAASYGYAAIGHDYAPPADHRLKLFRDGDDGPDGDEVVPHFLLSLTRLVDHYLEASVSHKDISQMRTSPAEEARHESARACYLCGSDFAQVNKVRDHCHFTGRYRGAACPSCNASARVPQRVPVYFHNLGSFDGQLLMRGITRLRSLPQYAEAFGSWGFSAIHKTGEKLLSITFGMLVFLDTMSFLQGSLADLIEGQRRSSPTLHEAFPLLSARHPLARDRASLPLLLRKVPFPYTLMRGPGCFSEVVQALQPRESYDSSLTGERCSAEAYEVVREVVDRFGLESFGEYHDLYLGTDVLALADCQEAFRAAFRQAFRLDPAHYVTLPAASYDAMLLGTRAKLQLISETNGGWPLMEEVNANVRGGVSCIFQPFAEANNPALAPLGLYDASKDPSAIAYWDVNSLYPSCMRHSLPVGDYALHCSGEESEAVLRGLLGSWRGDDDAHGFLCVVDLEVPREVHDLLDYPPPCRMEVSLDSLTAYQRQVREVYGKKAAGGEKLVPYLGPQTEVGHHIALLRYYVELGVRITRVHRIWRFRQEPFMREYMERCAGLRASATSKVMDRAVKTNVCSLYGKFLQDPEKQVRLDLHTSVQSFERAAARPSAKDFSLVCCGGEEGFLGKVQIRTEGQVVLKTPRLVGFSILELSKLAILRFHYGVVKARFGPRARLLMTDTDSLVYHLMTGDILADFKEMGEHLDLSESHAAVNSKKNEKVLGKLKDEFKDTFCFQFVGATTKMYSTLSYNPATREAQYIRKGKGIPKAVLLYQRKHEDYLRLLDAPAPDKVTFVAIRSKGHALRHLAVVKSGLSVYNDKVFQLDSRTSRPHGHWRNAEPEEPAESEEPPETSPAPEE